MRRKKSPQIRSEDVATFLPGFADMGTSQKLLRSKSGWSKEKKKEQQHNGQITSTNLSTNWNLFVKKNPTEYFCSGLRNIFCLKLISFKPVIAGQWLWLSW